jgi:hypothetical protein
MATRRTEAERIAALEAELAEAKAKAEAKARADEAKAKEKTTNEAARLKRRIDSLTTTIDELTEKRALLSLRLAEIGVEVIEVEAEDDSFAELTLDEV